MYFQDYLKNPLGKGAAMYPARQMYREYADRYKLISDDIRYKVHIIKDNIYIHFRIPSNVDTIYYDTVIEFVYNSKSGGFSVLDWDFKVFSNCPSFVYTYSHAYAKRDMLIKDLDKKYSGNAHKTPADTRNPYKVTGYEYSVFMALYHIRARRIYSLRYLKAVGKVSSNMNALYADIQDMDSILKRRKAKQLQIREDEKKQQALEKKEMQLVNQQDVLGVESLEKDTPNNKPIKTNNKGIRTAKESKSMRGKNKVSSASKVKRTKRI